MNSTKETRKKNKGEKKLRMVIDKTKSLVFLLLFQLNNRARNVSLINIELKKLMTFFLFFFYPLSSNDPFKFREIWA